MIIAFDADDTLWHNEDGFQRTHQEFQTMMQPWADAETVSATQRRIEQPNLHRYGFGVKAYMLSLMETAIEVSNGEIDGPRMAQILDLGKALIDRPCQLLDGVAETITELNVDHTLMVITKGDLQHQQNRIDESGLREEFWVCEVVAIKNTTIYASLFAEHEIEPNNFVMVGNSLPSDVLPVIELGARAVHIPYEVTWHHEQIDNDSFDFDVPTLDRITELPALIAQWHS